MGRCKLGESREIPGAGGHEMGLSPEEGMNPLTRVHTIATLFGKAMANNWFWLISDHFEKTILTF